MAWRFHGKRVEVSAIQPSAFATCDRCGCNTNHKDLRWQYDWAGNTLVNKRPLVCSRCLDTPSPFLKSLKLPLDPVPVLNSRPEPYSIDEGFSHPSADNTLSDASTTVKTADASP